MDEFNKLPDEFQKLGDEYNEKLPVKKVTRQDEKKQQKKSKKIMMRSLTASIASVAVMTTSIAIPSITELLPCDACSGTGIYCPGDPTFGYDRGNGHGYAGCNGTGYSDCPDINCENGMQPCNECLGVGSYKGEPICPRCNGTGKIICEFCNGTGTAVCITSSSHVKCEKCDGTGQMEIIHQEDIK